MNTPLPWRLLAAELIFLAVVTLFAAWEFTDISTNTKLVGGEMEFLTSSAHYAARQLHQHGYIPLWQPYLGEGRPLIESPFAFVLNPFSTVPSLLFGDGVRGIKLSVAIYALLTAGGGWFCGRAFGIGTTGRLLLALLLLGKGNMVALLGIGHFQLGVAQAYMPWIIGAAFLVLRGHPQRWPIVLLALAFALQFLAGNVWHTLPTLISLAVLTAAYIGWEGRFNWRGLRGMILAAALTVGLSAMVLLPLWAHRDFVGGQLPTRDGDIAAPVGLMLRQYISSEPLVEQLEFELASGELETRYNYTVPGWFVLLVFVLLPPVPLLHTSRLAGMRRVWIVSLLLVAFFTIWGIGGLQPFRWAYNNLPGLARWRFVGRAFGMASFWLALLVALRVDGLAAALSQRFNGRTQQAALAALMAVSLLAGLGVVRHNWRNWVGTVPAQQPSAPCLAWLFAQGAEPLVRVNQRDYHHVQIFLDVSARQFPVAAAYRPLSLPHTYYDGDLRARTLPPYAMPTRDVELDAVRTEGYIPNDASPPFTWIFTGERWPCLWEKPDEPPYAFSARADELERFGARNTPIRRGDVRPLMILERSSDHITLAAQGYGGARGLAVVQEVAYPGWQAALNGQQVPMESVGGFIGVLLPLSTDTQIVTFVYRPTLVYVGAALTLTTSAFCVLYLLRADRFGYSR